MVLSRNETKKRLKLPIGDPGSLVITPLLQEASAFSVDAIDLRLGTHFLLPHVPPRPFSDLSLGERSFNHLKVHIPFGDYLVAQAHQTVLGATLEFIKLPFDVAGQILTKSSVARTFVVIEAAPWIHPSYRGCLTLEIANLSNTPMLLYPGLPIGQLILLAVTNPVAESKLGGSYLGPVYPEAPPPGNVTRTLKSIGVDPTSVKIPQI
jgi:dCTP deaminase